MTPSPRLNNRQVAQYFRDIGDMMQILGENRFKILAYQNAARTLEELNRDIYAIFEEGALEDIPGVGEAIAEKISELLESGTIQFYERLTNQVPAGVVQMMRVPDVGPKTAERLWKELDITDLEGMRIAAEEGRIRSLKGFGAKSEEKILKGIEVLSRRSDDRTPLGVARPLADELIDAMKDALDEQSLTEVVFAGSLRRWRETIGDLDLLATGPDPEPIMEAFRSLPQAVDVQVSGERKSSIVMPNGMQVDLRVVKPEEWGAALVYFTGSQAHNIRLRERALEMGWTLNEYGVAPAGESGARPDDRRHFDSEEALYDALNLEYIAPEMREDQGEIQAAAAGDLPKLIELADIQGELHGHTTGSDGKNSIAEMAEAARHRGYQYWNVTDHSVGLGITGGVDRETLAEQRREIEALNEQYASQSIDFRLFLGSEVEVLADGSLGLDDETMAELDIVVASIHTGLRQDRETITRRALNAVRNPHVHILGHPTGRLIGRRAPSDIDLDAVLEACAETGTVVEINANPHRLDLSGNYARRAVELGCKIAINTDAHSTDGLDYLVYGVATARRGWLRAADVVNTLSAAEMLDTLK